MTDDPVRIVEAGYDVMAETYLAAFGSHDNDPRLRAVDSLRERLPLGARVLELGCGAGLPATARLAERFAVLGIDVSGRQIDLARANVPNARFQKADFLGLDFPAGSFDAATAYYCFGHVPPAEHAPLLTRLPRWLRPGGLLSASFATSGSAVVEPWLGVPMYFGGHDVAGNRSHLTTAGFTMLADEVIIVSWPSGGERWHWVLAEAGEQRSAGSTAWSADGGL